ncbi:MAG: inosine/xanthosine triphosphatase [Nitrospirota bacterium]
MPVAPLIVHIGSTNPVKIDAVREVFSASGRFPAFNVVPREVATGVAEQPTSLDETLRGAINRARNAFGGCDLSVGLEDGLFAVPHTQSGYMNVCACAIFDGRRDHLGLASAFEYPPEVVRLVINDGLDVTQAFVKAGLSTNAKLGAAEGAIGVLTDGRLTRRAYAEQAVGMALIHLPHPR